MILSAAIGSKKTLFPVTNGIHSLGGLIPHSQFYNISGLVIAPFVERREHSEANVESRSANGRTLLVVTVVIALLIGVVVVRRSRARAAAAHELRIQKVENGLLVDPFVVTGVPPQTQSVVDAMRDEHIPALSLAVVDNNRVAWARAYGVTQLGHGVPVTIHTQFSAGSLTKFVSALAVLKLVDQGKLELDRDIRSYLVSWQLPDPQAVVTLRELLSHSSGLSQHFPHSYPLGDPAPSTGEILSGKLPARTTRIEFDGKPGEKFDYSSAGFEVIQKVLEDVTAKTFPQVIQEQVFTPAGMTESTFEQPGPSNYDVRAVGHVEDDSGKLKPEPAMFPELASSGMWTTPSDLARLLVRLQAEPRFLSDASFKAMITPVRENAGLGVFLVGQGDSLRFRARTSDGRPEDGFTGWLTSYASQGKAAVLMANSHTAFGKGFAVLRAVAREYEWPGYLDILPKPQYSRGVEAYVGTYKMDEPLSISDRGGSLVVSYSELKNLPLLPSGEDSFVVNFEPVSDFVLKFHIGADGKADRLNLTTGFRHFEAPRIGDRGTVAN